jgi:hypothetical protein
MTSQKSRLLAPGLLSLIILGFAYNAQAQSGYLPSYNLSVPTPLPKVDYYSKFDGSPFLSETSMKANIITNEGNQYNNISVRYDLVNDIIVSDQPANEEDLNPVIINNISTVMFRDAHNKVSYFESGFPPINSFNEKTLYQVMTNGSAKILKKPSKSLVLRKVYSSQPVNEVVSSSKYFVYHDNKMVEVKKSKESLLSALPEKQSALGSYINNNHLNLKKDKDMDAVLSYYNTL